MNPRRAIPSLTFSLLLAATLLCAPSCKGRHVSDASAARYERVFEQGQKDARSLLDECDTRQSVQRRLLDINARITHIETRMGADAAADYEVGFRQALHESGDTLAAVLFPD